MKVLSAILSTIVVTSALQRKYPTDSNDVDDDSGQYVPDNSGQYVHDDSGSYIPDRSGDYVSDGLGLYSPDESEKFQFDGSGSYQDRNGGSQPSRDNFYSRRQSSLPKKYKNPFFGGPQPEKIHRPPPPPPPTGNPVVDSVRHPTGNDFGNAASATSQVLSKSSGFGAANPNRYDQARYGEGKWSIIRQDQDVDIDGYHWEYETENGISAQEAGKVYNKGSEGEVMKAKGFFQYTGPDNIVYYVSYTADENGFVPSGNHLPTPPPIPDLILKSLDHLKSTGKL